MALDTNGSRQRWTTERRRKEPSLYDEWLNQERAEKAQHAHSPSALTPTGSGEHTPQQHPSDNTSVLRNTPGTIRAVTPDDANAVDARPSQDGFFATERGTSSFERAFIPHLGTTTTIVGGSAAAPTSPSSSSSKNRRLLREREWEREARIGQQQQQQQQQSSPPTNRNVTRPGMLGRSSSRSNGNGHQTPTAQSSREAYQSARPRTRTLDESRRRERSPNSVMKSRNRMGSVTSSSNYQGAEYLASVPAAMSFPSAPSINSIPSVGSPVQPPSEGATRSISPMSTDTATSTASGLPPAGARRIVHLMKTLGGRTSGNVVFRRGETSPWSQIYCYVRDDTGSLMFEPRGGESAHRVLVSDLRGCSVRPCAEDDTPYLEVTLPHSEMILHVKLLTQSDFDHWFATFLYWQSQELPTSQSNGQRPASSSHTSSRAVRPEAPPRTSSARNARERAGSNKSDRRKSVLGSSREAPVIKIGKMIFWDTNVGYSSNVASQSPPVGHPTATSRPQAYRMQSYGSRRWRRISGQLRENGELKLHSDADNSLISIVQLSQLSRCAIQRLDSSVLENEFCLAIYPQYTSTLSNTQPGFVRPIFLSLENRVLYEVWFVLLRAFTIPQLYGPPNDSVNGESTASEEYLHAATTADMFRVERSLSIRTVEAKMYPPATHSATTSEAGFSGGHNKGSQAPPVKPEQHGYYAEVLLDNESRGKTVVKYEGLNPLWAETFDFVDLPPVLTSASVVIKRRPPDSAHQREQHESKLVHEAYGFTSDQHGGFTGLTFDVTCGKVEIYLQELEADKEVEKWWPVVNMYGQRVGEVLIKARAEEGVILMAHDYQPLGDLLHRFSNGLTLQVAQFVPSDLKRLSDCLLNIYQVSGKVSDWLMSLIEEEIDGIHKETPLSRLRYSRRMGSNDSSETPTAGGSHSDRELIVRDLNKNATLEANLLFRGNTLLTKSVDTHMRRIGKEYLEECLAAKIKEINDKDPDCEVDPNRLTSPQDLDRNWRRLKYYTQEVWKAIVATKQRCPIELRVIFRHIRACAEDRYGDFLRTVVYSSVSGFLFLRFFCPAVLNPKLFGLVKDDIKPRARRTFTLIAKSLQTLANMVTFGTKEHWMEPMNEFLTNHREGFKTFIDDVCYVPTPSSQSTVPTSSAPQPTYQSGVVSADTHLSYTTPMTIMQRLPPTSREGFPSLPYLIDQARAFADLVQLWLETTSPSPTSSEANSTNTKRLSDVMHAIRVSEGDLVAFHDICSSLNQRTQECLNRAERAERPSSALSFRWEELINQLQNNQNSDSADEMPSQASFDMVADVVARDPSILPPELRKDFASSLAGRQSKEWDTVTESEDDEAHATRLYDLTPRHSGSTSTRDASSLKSYEPPYRDPQRERRERPISASFGANLQSSLRKALQSRASDHSQTTSASASNLSSAVNSDTEHTTALPSYEREVRHRERREAAKQQIQQQVEEAKAREREKEKEKKKGKTPLAALRKKKEREGRNGSMGVQRGVDMSMI